MAQQPGTYSGRHAVQLKAMEIGWLGWVFGKGAAVNVACFVVLLLVSTSVFLVLLNGMETGKEFWEMVSPFLTLAIGYLFGKGFEHNEG